jgi:hypothetical protein
MAVVKRPVVIAIIEIAMLLGIVLAAFILPRSTPLWIFLTASGACLLGGNIYLFVGLKRGDQARAAGIPTRKPRVNLVIITMGILLLLLYLVNRR